MPMRSIRLLATSWLISLSSTRRTRVPRRWESAPSSVPSISARRGEAGFFPRAFRMVFQSVTGFTGLTRKPAKCRFSALFPVSLQSVRGNHQQLRMLSSGSLWILSATSMPFMPGIFQSSKTREYGVSVRAARTRRSRASCPEATASTRNPKWIRTS